MSNNEMEEKWLKRWEEAKLYEFEPDERPGVLVTAAFPYLNMPLHIGHIRTYGTADLYSRYLRLQGKTVLYPMAVHKTGTPALAIAKRVSARDPDTLYTMKNIYEIPQEDIDRMTDVYHITDYFEKIATTAFRTLGLGIDWRRRFSSIDPIFSKMVEWQFAKLNEKGYLTTGTHVIGWCPNEQNAVGQHDTKGDVHPEIDTMTVIYFKDRDSDVCFPCATYRPETIYVATNIFVNEGSGYVIAEVNGKKEYLSENAASILKYQLDIKELGKVSGKELIKKHAINPVTGEAMPVLSGFFVKDDLATGIVMSVPAHAPFDYVALERLRSSGKLTDPIKYKSAISLETDDKGLESASGNSSQNQIPSELYLKRSNANAGSENAEIESATKLQYKEELAYGVMSTGEYKGMRVNEARAAITEKMMGDNTASTISVLTNDPPVYCRCGTKAVPKLVDDQWFIDYGNEKWKAAARMQFGKMKIYPETARGVFNATIDWIDERPAERAQGLGTKFPQNPKHVIESLSDSTIYPTLYTYIYILKSKGIEAERLKPEFFDYVYGNADDVKSASSSTGIDELVLKRCRDELFYWYACTSRHSGTDLIPSHLTMYVFNHVGLLRKELWPSQIVTNGLVDYKGAKMSKSAGNIVPIIKGIKTFGADILRFLEVVSADIESNTEFKTNDAENTKAKNEWIYWMVKNMDSLNAPPLGHIDYWLYSKLNSKIKSATDHIENLSLRKAYIEVYYNSINELKHYLSRGGKNRAVVQEFLEKMVVMLSPAMPYFAEELWSVMGHDDFVERERWPIPDESMINEKLESIEDVIISTVSDINGVIELTRRHREGEAPKLVRIIIASNWKSTAYNVLARTKNIKDALQNVSLKDVEQDKLFEFMSGFAKKLMQINKISVMDESDMANAIRDSSSFIEKSTGAKPVVELESVSDSKRSGRALPNKPAIEIIWGASA